MMAQPLEPTDTFQSKRLALPDWLVSVLHLVIVAALPLVLVLANARLLMGRPFLRMEYYRPGFPADSYGFSADERMTYSAAGLDYLFNGEDESFLGVLTFEDGSPLFNERELSHMTDVKNVTAKLTRFGVVLFIVYGVSIVLLAFGKDTQRTLFAGLFTGSVLTIALIVLGIGATVAAFDWLFTQFHGLFFKGDTWLFPTSDTLIRLYPERFWIDAFVIMFGGALLEAAILGVITWFRLCRLESDTV